jgi:CBS domain-containing protein
MQVKEVMTRGVECIHPEATLQEAADKMKSLDIGPLPVCENERLVGMITDRDITVRGTADGLPPRLGRVGDVMTPDIIYCFDDQDVSEAARMMELKQIRRLLVLNHDMRLAGIVSLGDVAVKAGDANLTYEALERVSEPAAPQR